MAASYPGSVKTFASRSNGQTIDASHVNDLQDEVNAIEAGLLNGTARLNSSNTVIGGTSTLVGNVTCQSSVTIGNGLTVSSGQIMAPGQAGWHLYSTAIITGTANSTTRISFLTELLDISGFHSTATSPQNITVPSGSSGRYLIGVSLLALTVNATFQFHLDRNDTKEFSHVINVPAAQQSYYFESLLSLRAADVVSVEILGPASTWSVGNATVNFATRCWGAKVS